jgi:hypothetical protein
MAWGFGTLGYGAHRTADMMGTCGFNENVRSIVKTVQSGGAGDGWTDLLRDHRISGLGMAYGTKLLYFAGYQHAQEPLPLILDVNVRSALQVHAPGSVPAAGRTIWRADFECYLHVAEQWAADPTWSQEPDVVEYAFFDRGGPPRPDRDADSTDPDASP